MDMNKESKENSIKELEQDLFHSFSYVYDENGVQLNDEDSKVNTKMLEFELNNQ